MFNAYSQNNPGELMASSNSSIGEQQLSTSFWSINSSKLMIEFSISDEMGIEALGALVSSFSNVRRSYS